MYSVICFKVVNGVQKVQRFWIKEEKQVCQLVYDGYTVYRAAYDQQAQMVGGEQLMWQDVKLESIEE